MDGVGAIKSGFQGAHMWYQGTVGDVTQEQANTQPQGGGLPIGATMAHVLHSEDFMVNQVIRGQTPLWENGWKAKVGGEMVLDINPDAARQTTYSLPALMEYGQAVFANTESFISGIKDSDLERELELKPLGFPSNMGMGAFLTQMLLGNTYAHTGEISFIKGMLGAKGFPF
jgi:hypothetical protein